jgi:hypothetical protein
MKTPFFGRTLGWQVGALILVAMAWPVSGATTFWTGPNINWSKSVSTPSDAILPGKVVLTRGTMKVLYNTAAGETSAGASSPKGTLWAFGSFSNHTAFQTLDSMRNGNLAARIVNQPMVLWMTNDDIFVSIRFTTWGMRGAGTVAYTRSTPGTVVAPTVSITAPTNGSTFTAPAHVDLAATATVSGGTVTNVAFFNNHTNLLGSVKITPFNLTASNLTAGIYALSAVATAAGVSGTSAVVNITVMSPLTLTSPTLSGDMFSFSYNADPGQRYVIQRATMIDSANVFDWVSVTTNTAASSPVVFSENVTTNVSRFYRVGRLPNP